MKKNAHQFLFIGSLEVLIIEPQKNRTKTVGFLVGLSKTIKLGLFFFSYKMSKTQNIEKNHKNKMFQKFVFTYNNKFLGL